MHIMQIIDMLIKMWWHIKTMHFVQNKDFHFNSSTKIEAMQVLEYI